MAGKKKLKNRNKALKVRNERQANTIMTLRRTVEVHHGIIMEIEQSPFMQVTTDDLISEISRRCNMEGRSFELTFGPATPTNVPPIPYPQTGEKVRHSTPICELLPKVLDEIDGQMGYTTEPEVLARHAFKGYDANPGICSVCGAVAPLPCFPLAVSIPEEEIDECPECGGSHIGDCSPEEEITEAILDHVAGNSSGHEPGDFHGLGGH